MGMLLMKSLFYFDHLTLLMISLVSFVGINVALFSRRYLQGDTKRGAFYINLVGLILAVFAMVSADHLVLLFLSWLVSNLLLTRLMLHKRQWSSAYKSSQVAWHNFLLGLIFLAAGLFGCYQVTGSTSIQQIVNSHVSSGWILVSVVMIFLAAMTQSALWPFHKWLISSLNSPTPVSAMMHAGLVNGGGFILARFGKLFIDQPTALMMVFTAGMVSAVVGTLWKLMQSDVKRMLACSTMGQMGFMMVQCGLGLFPAAVAHLCWHGLFKAYLFLGSGAAAQERRLDLRYPPTGFELLLALIGGFGAAYGFAILSGKNLFVTNTNLFLIVVALVAGTQFALVLLRSHSWNKLLFVFIFTSFAGAIYGVSVRLIELLVLPVGIFAPQPLNSLHVVALALLVATWFFIILNWHRTNKDSLPPWALSLYVAMLNASQPHKKTVTAHRNQYQL